MKSPEGSWHRGSWVDNRSSSGRKQYKESTKPTTKPKFQSRQDPQKYSKTWQARYRLVAHMWFWRFYQSKNSIEAHSFHLSCNPPCRRWCWTLVARIAASLDRGTLTASFYRLMPSCLRITIRRTWRKRSPEKLRRRSGPEGGTWLSSQASKIHKYGIIDFWGIMSRPLTTTVLPY